MNFYDSKTNWEISLKNKSNLIIQLKPVNENVFLKNYSISKFPSFILINPEGKLISTDFTRPDDKFFDTLLETYLKK